MKNKLIIIFGVLAIGSFCSAGNTFALTSDSIESAHIIEADGTSGQDTNSGSGVKTGHIQDGAVTDSKINAVAMAKVTGLTEAIAAIPAGPQGVAGADGIDGATGPQGVAGTDGQNGINGSDGFNGLSCWDLNGDDITDANEDLNGDGYWDTLDCKGASGVLYLTTNAITEPFPCEPAAEGAVALNSFYTLCVCNSSDWVLTVDGTTSCDWGVPTVTTATGQVWMDRNLGASRVATSMYDAAAYGDLYQWGRGADGHQLRTSLITTIKSSTDDPGHSDFILADGPTSQEADWREPPNHNLWQGVSGINNPCPDGFRVPTYGEWKTEGYLWQGTIGPISKESAYASVLKVAAAGIRQGSNGVIFDGISRFWTQTSTDSFNLRSNDEDRFYEHRRSMGYSVRCIMD